MNKKLVFGLLLFGAFSAKGQTISAARTAAVGSTVTVRGTVTNGSELGPIRYIQDGTGAIPAYGALLNGVQRGDSITATGVLFDYNGLLEISPTNSFTAQGVATQAIVALPIPITAVAEAYEAQLLQFTNVTFTSTGTFAGNTNYNITDGTNTLAVRIATGSNLVGTAIPTGSVSVKGILSQFNTFQLLPRDQNDIVPYVAPAREINVKIGGLTYLTGTQYVVGTTTATPITIENLGTGNLTISGTGFSGVNSTEYTTTFAPQTIAGGATATLNMQFVPLGTGSRFATLTINSNDVDEAAYTISMYGIGTDGLATEPTANPTNLTFPVVKAYSVNGAFTASANTENYLVVWSNGTAVTGAPVDGTNYMRGDVVGNGRVAYVGPATNFIPRHVIANQNLNFAVYAFNGPDGFENYRTAAPLVGNVTSQGAQIGNYYSGISATNTNLVSQLSTLINPHTVISYTNYKTTVMTQFEVQDTTQGRSFVVCSYSGERKVFNDPFDWTAVGYSREHSYCHSWMPTYPADNPAKPEYSDQHNLYPVNQNQANSPRSNLPMDVITGNVVFTYLEGRAGYNGSQLVYEPRDAQKGNAARSMMYMATAYNNVSGNNWGFATNQPEAILKTWHYQDLPDNYEIARNEYIYSVQGNRNPYVDSVDFVCPVQFVNMSYSSTGCNSLSVEEMLDANFSVFPVPASNMLYLQVNATTITGYSIVDASGRSIMNVSNVNLPVAECNISSLTSGVYFVTVNTPFGVVNRNFVVE